MMRCYPSPLKLSLLVQSIEDESYEYRLLQYLHGCLSVTFAQITSKIFSAIRFGESSFFAPRHEERYAVSRNFVELLL